MDNAGLKYSNCSLIGGVDFNKYSFYSNYKTTCLESTLSPQKIVALLLKSVVSSVV